ncbi:MAG: hypothetical protein JWN25_2794 [Verrucomicrobiales bacterium]|nr:hypothetical protein [Verrucomicrobiales bacterium]
MKRVLFFLSLCMFSYATVCSNCAADEWRKYIDSPVTSKLYILFPHSDLRELFCSTESILDREKRQVVCIQNHLGVAAREFSVATNGTMATLFKTVGGTNFSNNTQFRLIQKDTVLQCRWRSKGPKPEGWGTFLAAKIEPGDILVICPRDDEIMDHHKD